MRAALKKTFLFGLFVSQLIIILFFWWKSSAALFSTDLSGVFLALGRVCGLLAAFFVLLQFLLMGRTVWVEKVFGLDKLAQVHRLNGYAGMFFLVAHFLFLLVSYALYNEINLFAQLIDFLWNYEDVFLAFIAFLFFLAVVFSSIYIVRKKLRYETWYAVHLITYLAVLLGFFHQLELGGSLLSNKIFIFYWYALYLFVFGNVLIFRFLKPLYCYFRFRFYVQDIVQETSDTNSVYIGGKNLEKFRIDAGQFVMVRFLAKGFWTQSHPFSLSAVSNKNQLRITIKNLGDFTSKISSLQKGTPVLIEGPFGVFTVPFSKEKRKFLFIAGGVGITPIRALLEKLAPNDDLVLLYGNKTSKDVIFKDEIDTFAKKHGLKVHYVMSDEKDFPGEKGRIDKEKLSRLVPDILEREIFLCGPGPMMESVCALLMSDFGVRKNALHYEKFSL